MNYDIIVQYIRPELLILVIILYLIGTAIKHTKYIRDELIPFILGVLSVLMSAVYILSVSPAPSGYQEVLSLVFNIVIQGICCAAAAVYFNQNVKQYKKLKTTEETSEES